MERSRTSHTRSLVVPTFFIMGAAKSGTTSLHSYLDLHPEISMSTIKEPHYFAPAHPQFASKYRWGRVGDPHSYSALFDPECGVRGESSTTYSEHPFFAGVAQRIHSAAPRARFIYLLRDPIERLRAHYLQRYVAGARKSFARTIEGGQPENELICASRYMEQLTEFRRFFPEDRFLILDQEDLRTNRNAELARIFRFLGVRADYASADFTKEFNRSADKRSAPTAIRALARSTPVHAATKRLPMSLQASLWDFGRKLAVKPVAPPEMPENLATQLRRLFAPEADALRALTGQSFSSWSV